MIYTPQTQPVVVTVLTSKLDLKSIDLLRIEDVTNISSSIGCPSHLQISYTELVNALKNSELTLKSVKMEARNDIPDNHDFFKIFFSINDQPSLNPDLNISLRGYDIKGNSMASACLFKRVEAENNAYIFELKSVDHLSRDSKSNLRPLRPWKFSNKSVSFLHIKNLPANNFYTFYFYFEE